MKRILLDQGLPAKVTSVLRRAGWDAVHVREIAMSEAQDVDILEFAARESRVAVTLDRDFPQILALTAAKRPSVVLIRQQRLRAAAVAALLESLWREYEGVLESGCVVTVGAHGTRVHTLPLK
jgi:predicted nuclease of predicted toxin-antitoxin system